MKIKILSMVLFSGLLFTACENELEKKLKFDVSVTPSENVVIGDSTVTAPQGTTVKFKFTGDADFISFSMKRFNQTKSALTFSSQPSWGTHIENTLSVFLSEAQDSILLKNPKADSATIANRQWTDITSLCNLPTVAKNTGNAVVPLDTYRGKKVIIAFRYKTTYADDWQPQWLINNLQINDTVAATGRKVKSILAATMGFCPFDMLNLSAPYSSQDVPGVWNVSVPSSIKMKMIAKGNPLNTDWLISKPVMIDLGVDSLYAPVPVKKMSAAVDSYSYQFTEPGEYTITFSASNNNYLYQEAVERKIKIIIKE